MRRDVGVPLWLLLFVVLQSPHAHAQTAAAAQAIAVLEQVRAIAPPRAPLPAEAASAGVNEFSFIVYGDTRGPRDGDAEQYEHSLVVGSVVATIQRLAGSGSSFRPATPW